jgi:SAM-dependent methyltransferase
MTNSLGAYPGGELELFARARNWKRYLADRLAPHITGEVAEVGAGLGAMTAVLCGVGVTHWLCLEPDASMAAEMARATRDGELPAPCRVFNGTLADIAEAPRFDAILYIDVLEHIEEDRAELERAARRLKLGGRLVVLAPAHPWLFSPFDKAIGHYRRYRLADTARLAPPGAALVVARYLDSVGLLASLANKLWLRASMPSLRQILIWDRLMVPLSRLLDRLAFGRLGKSVLFVWRKA